MDMMERLHQAPEKDIAYKKLNDLVQEGIVQRYWLENNLSNAKEGLIYMPKGKL